MARAIMTYGGPAARAVTRSVAPPGAYRSGVHATMMQFERAKKRCLLAQAPDFRYVYEMSSLLPSAGRALSLASLLGGLLLLLRLARR
jgi:GAF domain-containing protein